MTIEIFLLILFIGILVFTAVTGYTKGLLRQLAEMTVIIMAMICTYLFNPIITQFLDEHTGLREAAYTASYQIMDDFLADRESNTRAAIYESLDDSYLPGFLVSYIVEKADNADTGRAGFCDSFAEYMSGVVVKMTGLLTAFIIAFILMMLVLALTGFVNKIPIIGDVNQALGLIAGLIKGCIILWLACVVITAMSTTTIGQKLMEAISNNIILNGIYTAAMWVSGAISHGEIFF